MNFVSPSRLPASAKIALFEEKRRWTPCPNSKTNDISSPSFQRPTKSSASRAVFTAISPNASRRNKLCTKSPDDESTAATSKASSVPRVVSPCNMSHASRSSSSRSHKRASSDDKTTIHTCKPTPPSMLMTPRKQTSPLKNKRHNILPSARDSSSTYASSGNLSPASHSSTPATMSRLRRQIDYLRRRVHILENENTDVSELLDLIQAKEDECTGKDEQLQTLTTKLKKIETGLQEIEQEREALSTKATRLEMDKQTLNKQLANREREIVSLSARCASETDKVKESNNLRSKNVELTKQVQSLEETLAQHKKSIKAIELTRSQLKQCQDDRDDLIKRLHQLEKEFALVDEKRRACLANAEKLMEEKNAWEAERQRLVRSASLDLQQERQNYIQSTFELNEALRFRDAEILRLKQTIQVKETDAAKLRRTLSEREQELESARQLDREEQSMNRKLVERVHELEEIIAQQEQTVAVDRSALAALEQCQSERTTIETQLQAIHVQLAAAVASSEDMMEEKCAWEEERLEIRRQAKLQQQESIGALAVQAQKIDILEQDVTQKSAAIVELLDSERDLKQSLHDLAEQKLAMEEEHLQEIQFMRDSLAQHERLAEAHAHDLELDHKLANVTKHDNGHEEKLGESAHDSIDENQFRDQRIYALVVANQQKETVISTLRVDMERLKDNMKTLKKTCDGDKLNLQQELRQCRLELEQQHADSISLNQLIAELRRERDELRENLVVYEQDLSSLNQKFIITFATSRQLANEKCAWEEERLRLEDKALGDLNELRQRHAQSNQELEDSLKVQDELIATMQTSAYEKERTLTLRIAGLEDDLNQAKAEVADFGVARVEQTQVGQELHDALTRLANASSDFDLLAQSRDKLQKCLDDTELQLHDIRTKYSDATSKLENCCRELLLCQHDRDNLQQRLNDTEDALIESEARFVIASSEAVETRQELTQCQNKVEDCQRLLEQRERELIDAKDESVTALSEAAKARQDLTQCQSDLDEVLQRLQRKELDMTESITRYDSTNTELNALRWELEQCQTERDGFRNELEQTEKTLMESLARLNSASTEYEIVCRELAQGESERGNLQRCLEQSEIQLAEARALHTSATTETIAIRLELVQSQSERNDFQQRLEQSELMLADTLSRHASKTTEAKQELAQCQTERSDFQRRLEYVEQQYLTLDNRYQLCLAARDCLAEEKREMQAKINELDLHKQRQIQSMRELIDEQKAESICTKKLQMTVSENEKTIEALQMTLTDMRSKLKNLGEMQMSIESLKTQLENKDSLVAMLKDEVESTMTQMMAASSLVEKAADCDAKMNTLTTELEALQREKEAFTDMKLQLDIRVAELEAETIKLAIGNSFAEWRLDSYEVRATCQMLTPPGSPFEERDDLETDSLNRDSLIEGLRQQCAESDKDIVQLTEEIVSLVKERDELRNECLSLQQYKQDACLDRRGLLNSLEKHASSVDKLTKLERSTIDKLAASEQALKTARFAVKERDEKIKALECELKKLVTGSRCLGRIAPDSIQASHVYGLQKVAARQATPFHFSSSSDPVPVSDDEESYALDRSDDSDEILFNSLSTTANDSLVDLNLDVDLETLLAL
ncbi:hypothetical protein MPSEU_000381500 [Mayamaea pseudoterrestris]|nr:hypothetical protein MPSEU_000381500 [Mayamaea pseudoterrestris]